MNQDVKPIYLDALSVAAFVSLSEATVQNLVRENKFPKPRMISAHRVAWLTREVEEWAEAQPVSIMLPPARTPAATGRKRAIPPPQEIQSSRPKQ